MFFRVLIAPPGYMSPIGYMVGEYQTAAFESFVRNLVSATGAKVFSSIEEARKLIPKNAVRLPYDRDAQFLELWSTEASHASPVEGEALESLARDP